MKISLSELALDAISALPSPQEQEAASRPPYPMPAYKAAFLPVAREALRRRLEQGGADPLCSTALLERAQKFSDAARVELANTDGPAGDPQRLVDSDVCDMICLLLAGGLIPVDTARKAAESSACHLESRFLQRAIVYRHLADGDAESAKAACDDPVWGDEAWVGWRAVGEHFAAAADAKSFLALWPKYQARQGRDWMDDMRRSLVAAVSRARGWREAVALTRDKHIGNKGHFYGMLYVALTPFAESGDTKTLRRLFDEPALAGLDEFGRLQLLVDAMCAAMPGPAQTDHPELGEILARIIAIDPAVSKQQSRQRDGLLLDCWPVVGEPATLKRLRAAIRAPLYRREISGLAKDIP
ncbi:MAG: hypothetical protein LBI59_01925 [Candidatus Accumulibacter sp.]|jgi:hypothetical protein|nr:hypothetical protein [Accumulibacter sp.]